MDVHEIGSGNGRRERVSDTQPRRERPERDDAIVEPSRAAWHPCDGPRDLHVPSSSGRMRHVFDPVTLLLGPGSELPREEGVGSLIRRKVRCDVKDLHQRAHTSAGRTRTCMSRNSANVAGLALRSRVAYARNRSSRSQNASSSA